MGLRVVAGSGLGVGVGFGAGAGLPHAAVIKASSRNARTVCLVRVDMCGIYISAVNEAVDILGKAIAR